METADIQASLQSPLFSRLDEDGDRRCDLIWASPVTFHFFPLCVLKRCSPLPLYFEPKPNLSKTLKGLLICVSCQYHLRNIAKIGKYLSEDTSQILVHLLISSKLDNCNSLLYGLPKHLLNRLRLIQNTAACIVTLSKRFDHVTPILFKLHSGAPNGNFRENICSEDDFRSRIFGAFVVKCLACLPLLGFSNIYKMA